jgi:hypothetical protein
MVDISDDDDSDLSSQHDAADTTYNPDGYKDLAPDSASEACRLFNGLRGIDC